ncbi:MAG: hypothetical protein HOY78_02180 [Saccharothrix sp.]|nr:hypothetical protein [Saccharothrix sp.]
MSDWVTPVLEPQVVLLCLLLTLVAVVVVAVAVLGLGAVLALVRLVLWAWGRLVSRFREVVGGGDAHVRA